MQVKSIAECSKESIMQYFRPSLSSICLFVCLFDSLHSINNLSVIKGRVFLGWTSTKLGLMFLLKDTTQWRWWGLNPRPLGLESSTLPLSHCVPKLHLSLRPLFCLFLSGQLRQVLLYNTFKIANNKGGNDQTERVCRLVYAFVVHMQQSPIFLCQGPYQPEEQSGSVIECLTWDQAVPCLGLTGGTMVCPWARCKTATQKRTKQRS